LTANSGQVEFSSAHSLKRTIPTAAAKLYAFREARTALRARDYVRGADGAAGAAIKTAAARWRKVFASRGALKLCLNNLFNAVGTDFDNSFVVNFAGAGDAQHVLAGWN